MAAPSPSSITFADLLRYHRTAAGLTQEELAARAQLSRDAVSTLERGTRRRPRRDTVALLADALALPDEERTAFAAAARKARTVSLAATPPTEAAAVGLNGHASASFSDTALPHGVVTFLFAELEDSTRLLHQLDDRYADVQTLLSTIWAAHAGHELGTQGDRFFAVFASAEDALAAAAAAQQALAAHAWPDDAPVRLRMGVHSGAALLTAGRYVGPEVHRAMRIAAAGYGGQVVVSHAAADQVAKFGYTLPDSMRLRDLGKHRLQELPHREELYQLVLPDLPRLPATYPPLRTLDAWPGLRADLTAVVGMSAVLLAVVGLLLPLAVPVFPWAVGLGAAGVAMLVLLSVVLARPLRRALETQWRDARKPVSAVTSALLSLVVISTTLFITKPPIVIGPKHLGYDFTYTSHAPTHKGGMVTVGLWGPLPTLAPYSGFMNVAMQVSYLGLGLWNGCLTWLPDTTLGLAGWKPDECTEVPTIDNGGESPDYKTTIFHIDPRAVWSDGVSITADDYLLSQHLLADPNLGGTAPWNQMQLTALDPRTVRIDWSVEYGDYLTALGLLVPLPLHAYATGPFAGVYNPQTGAYNSKLARQLTASTSFNAALPVDSGPFTVQSFVPSSRAVLVRNPHFFSNFFHHPSALDGVTFFTANPQWPDGPPKSQVVDTLVAAYRQGAVDLVDGLDPYLLGHFGGIPKAQIVISPVVELLDIGFNQRDTAPNAQANGGVSIFRDLNVRKAFVEAFDRCAAVRAQLGITNCADPNLFTDEPTARPAPDYDPTFHLPGYNPAEAAALMDHAGYPVVEGVRRCKNGQTPLQISIDIPTGGAGGSATVIARKMVEDYRRTLKIAVTLVPVPTFFAGDFTTGGAAWKGTFDIALYGDDGAPDPVLNAGLIVGSTDAADIPSAQNPSGQDFLGIVDPWVVQREQLGSETLDGDQRAGVYREVKRHIAQAFYLEPVFIVADITLTKPTLCNFKKWPFEGANTWNMADWYVAPTCP